MLDLYNYSLLTSQSPADHDAKTARIPLQPARRPLSTLLRTPHVDVLMDRCGNTPTANIHSRPSPLNGAFRLGSCGQYRCNRGLEASSGPGRGAPHAFPKLAANRIAARVAEPSGELIGGRSRDSRCSPQ